MRILIHSLLLAAMAVPAVLLLRKQKRKLARGLILVSLLVGWLLVSALPFENLFYSFDSPEAVFDYMYDGRIVCQNVIPGQDCALVFGQEKVLAAVKSGEKWKIDDGFSLHMKSDIIDGVSLTLFRVRGADDTFVLVTADQEVSVSDRLGSEFTRLSEHWETGFVAYCAPVSAATESYALVINGVEHVVDLS